MSEETPPRRFKVGDLVKYIEGKYQVFIVFPTESWFTDSNGAMGVVIEEGELFGDEKMYLIYSISGAGEGWFYDDEIELVSEVGEHDKKEEE
jgi:hypothetical protein